jgi:hypothetical protein
MFNQVYSIIFFISLPHFLCTYLKFYFIDLKFYIYLYFDFGLYLSSSFDFKVKIFPFIILNVKVFKDDQKYL